MAVSFQQKTEQGRVPGLKAYQQTDAGVGNGQGAHRARAASPQGRWGGGAAVTHCQIPRARPAATKPMATAMVPKKLRVRQATSREGAAATR